MKKEIIQKYNYLSYTFLNECLFFSNDISNDLEKSKAILLREEYLYCFLAMLQSINQPYYPENAIKNAKTILMYIQNHIGPSELLQECFQKVEELEPSYEKYNLEFCIKNNQIKDFSSDYHIWNKKDMEESIRFDYSVYLSLLTPQKDYEEIFYHQFILNRNYLYAIRKILFMIPEIFKIKGVKNRVLELINHNLSLLEKKDEKTIPLYLTKNYLLKKEMVFYIEELEEFKEENRNLIGEVNHFNKIPFLIDEFKDYYHELYIEKYLYDDVDINFEALSLQDIYDMIKRNSENSTLDDKAKRKLLDLLHSKREKVKELGSSIEEYNAYLVMLNGIKINDHLELDEFNFRTTLMDQLKHLYQHHIKKDISFFYDVYSSKFWDLTNLKIFLASDEEYQYLKHYIEDDSIKENSYFPYSIMRFLREEPWLFQNEQIYQRTVEILENCNTPYSKRLLKKIQKLR